MRQDRKMIATLIRKWHLKTIVLHGISKFARVFGLSTFELEFVDKVPKNACV